MNPKPVDEESIFATAIEKTSPKEREAYLKGECGDNPKLFDRLKALLKSHDEESSFLKPPGAPTEAQAISEGPGAVIGPYKLLQQIGEGGFGVVYMAEQQHPVRRKVALKIIKPGMDTKQVIARFEAERQALALMDHPNIAKVLDAGSTDEKTGTQLVSRDDAKGASHKLAASPLSGGRPYFVMELVKGVPITDYCDKNSLSTHERLSLFVQVCRAVQHAHQKGVIHRDIKPSNVMVTLHDGHPVPKVIDFGVSKAISQQLTEKTLFTAYGQMLGTPQYMSPEQAEMSGLDVDTRSDVYSLGVLLYELLTGTTPLDSDRLRSLAYVEMQRVIREEEPPRPSARVSTMGGELTVLAKHHSTDPKRLPQLLRGDLDWIVMKALAKERGRRYESPSTLAADVQRHLSDDTIEARPPSTTYQMARFIRRHKGTATAAAVVLLVLLLGIAGTTTGLFIATGAKRRAVAEAARARIAEGTAVEAEGEARANLETSQDLSRKLSTSLAKLSEGASRLAAERAYTLIDQERPQDGLLWLNRALQLAPEGNTPLETQVRTAISTVAEELPQPLFVVAPEDGRVFSHAEVSRDGQRVLLLVGTDPPAAPEALEVRVLDSRTGTAVTVIDVSPETDWAAFSADRQTVFTADPAELRRYSAETGSALGPPFNLVEAFAEIGPGIPQRLKQLLRAAESAGRQLPADFLDRIANRFRPRIVAVGPDDKTTLFQCMQSAAAGEPGASGRPIGGGRFGGRGGPPDPFSEVRGWACSTWNRERSRSRRTPTGSTSFPICRGTSPPTVRS